MFKTIKDAEKIAHTLSAPSKMPCHSYSIPAQKCITGMKLRNVKGSICSRCYAFDRGRYAFDNVKDALFKRFESLTHPQWVDAMVYMINKKEKSGYMRIHDAGDIQGVWHLEKIAEVCRRLPHIKFWLPTREYSFVSEYMATNTIPDNLTIRLSALMFDGKPPVGIAKRLGLVTSGASTGNDFSCPSSKQGGKCLNCRACWDKSVNNVNYKIH